MRTTALFAAIGGLTVAGTYPTAGNAADGLDYTYLQLNAVGRDIDGFDDEEGLVEDLDDGGGWSIEGSWQFLPHYFAFGEFSNTESDVSYASDTTVPLPADTDILRFDIGIGTKWEINDRVDFIGRAAYVDVDYDEFDLRLDPGEVLDGGVRNVLTDEDDGFSVDAGVRSQITDNLEGTVGLRYTDVINIDTTTVMGSLMYEFNDNWGVDLSVDAGDDLSTYLLGVRFAPDI